MKKIKKRSSFVIAPAGLGKGKFSSKIEVTDSNQEQGGKVTECHILRGKPSKTHRVNPNKLKDSD